MAISSPLKPKVSIGSVKTVKKFQTILFNRTKVKKEIRANYQSEKFNLHLNIRLFIIKYKDENLAMEI